MKLQHINNNAIKTEITNLYIRLHSKIFNSIDSKNTIHELDFNDACVFIDDVDSMSRLQCGNKFLYK